MMAERRRTSRRPRTASRAVAFVAGLQILCGLFFVQDMAVSVLGLRTTPVSWTWREAIEIMATLGMVLGMVLGALLFRRLAAERRRDAQRLRVASGDFYAVVLTRFDDWTLTPSERDVAMFMLKGCSNQEIAALRETSEGTIKAQSTAIFRKSGVTGRAQFFSLFIDDLLTEEPPVDSAGRTGPQAA